MPQSPRPFIVTIWDKAFTRRGFVGDYDQLTATIRHMALGTATITVPGDHPRLPYLLADGARVTIDYDVAGDGSGYEQILSGPVTASQGGIPSRTTPVVIAVEDDFRLWGTTLGWPVPGAAIGAQNTSAYDTRTGTAEAVIKGFAQANMVGRLGLPLTVATSLGRGATIKVAARMDVLRDLLIPLAAAAGIGVTIRQDDGDGLVLDCYTPTVRTLVLTENSGVLVAGQWTRTIDAATDVVVGGQGDGTARTFRLVRSTARAAALGWRAETFKDATDLTSTADLDARGAQTLAESAAGAGVSLQLAETSTWRYGRAVRVGDLVPIALSNGLTITQQVGSVVLTHDKRTGLTVSPRVGDDTAASRPDAVLARALSRVAAMANRINTRR